MNCFKMYQRIIKEVGKLETKEEQFEYMFLLTCLLMYNLSCKTKNLDNILQLLKEFDYKKNFEG